jgi:hypothetical protein
MLVKNIPTQKIRRNKKKESFLDLEHSDTSSDNINYIDFPNNQIDIIDIIKIRKNTEKRIQIKVDDLYKEEELPMEEKKLKVLNEMTSCDDSFDRDNPAIEKEKENNISFSFADESTADYSSYSFDPNDEKNKYYIKYKLYDNIAIYNNQKVKLPKLMQIDQDKIYYLYLNKPITYYFIKSAYLGKNKSINYDEKDSDESKLNELYGLFFCGKKIEFNNESTICSPNNFICKNCMEKNKRRYDLKSKYLININGRIAKNIKDGNKGFHCFGHFFFGKIQIEICLNKFCCLACKLLNKYEKYYFSTK